MSKRRSSHQSAAGSGPDNSNRLRIIGGRFRGRWLNYSGDPRTRPMKDRVREAVFNLLADSVVGQHAIDLFAGTGALGLEALSRGATRATLLERHFPTAQLIRENAAHLGVSSQVTVLATSAFYWVRKEWQADQQPVVVFCSPPYDFYVEKQAEMQELMTAFVTRAASGSILVIESDARFDIDQLPGAIDWDVRHYAPAIVAIGMVGGQGQTEP